MAVPARNHAARRTAAVALVLLAALPAALATAPRLPHGLARHNGAAGVFYRVAGPQALCPTPLDFRADWADPPAHSRARARARARALRASVYATGSPPLSCGEYALRGVRGVHDAPHPPMDDAANATIVPREHAAVGRLVFRTTDPRCGGNAVVEVGPRNLVVVSKELVLALGNTVRPPRGLNDTQLKSVFLACERCTRLLAVRSERGRHACVYVDEDVTPLKPTQEKGLVVSEEQKRGRGSSTDLVSVLDAVTSEPPIVNSTALDSHGVIAMEAVSPKRDEDTSAESRGTNADEEREDTGNCFSRESTVLLRSGTVRRMDELQVGDEVLVAPNTFSKVFMFTHKSPKAHARFVVVSSRLCTLQVNGVKTCDAFTIRLTRGHFMYTSRGLLAAGEIVVGDSVELGNGRSATVERVVQGHRGLGLFNPHTLHGDIVVDGIRASSYTAFVHPALAHAILFPLRVLYRVHGMSSSLLENSTALRAMWLLFTKEVTSDFRDQLLVTPQINSPAVPLM